MTYLFWFEPHYGSLSNGFWRKAGPRAWRSNKGCNSTFYDHGFSSGQPMSPRVWIAFGSENSWDSLNSRKIHKAIFIISLNHISFQFYVVNFHSLTMQVISLIFSWNHAEIDKFFIENHKKWGKLSLKDITICVNGEKWNHALSCSIHVNFAHEPSLNFSWCPVE